MFTSHGAHGAHHQDSTVDGLLEAQYTLLFHTPEQKNKFKEDLFVGQKNLEKVVASAAGMQQDDASAIGA